MDTTITDAFNESLACTQKVSASNEEALTQVSSVELTDISLIRLLQLSSVSLPVGGYAFSQGMEHAIDVGWITNKQQVNQWVSEQLEFAQASTDLPLLRLMMQAVTHQDWQKLTQLNDLALACRETKELRLTDTAMGEALGRLLRNLGMELPFVRSEDVSFVSLFSLAASRWQISYQAAAIGFLWSWLENQIAAATKLVPLGQTQAQQLLLELQPQLSQAIEKAEQVHEDDIGNGLPALAIASAKHEIQYSRLFRS